MNEKFTKSDYLVVKSNDLIYANFDLSTQEQKIILMLASLVKPGDSEFYEYTFKIKDFMELLEIKNKNSYREISNITKGLMKKVLEIRDKEKKTLIQIAWLCGAKYKFGEGAVILKFSPDLKPYLLELKTLYTKYKLKNILSLRGKYSIRIYEILKCNAFKKQVNININELKTILKATSYKNNSDFRKRVINPALKEIIKKTDISFKFEEIRAGRNIIAIKFIISDKELELENNLIDSDKDNIIIDIKNKIRKITKSNIKLLKVNELLELKGSEMIYKYIDNYHKFKVNKHNPVGFLISAIEEEYPIPEEEINNYDSNKPVQSTNFEQRQYDDEYFDSLYDNFRE